MRLKQVQGYTVGAIAPSNPQNGDLWHELSPLGVSLHGWDWIRSAGRWVSPIQEKAASINNLAAAHVYWFDVYESSIQLLDFHVSVFHNVSQNNGHWTIELRGLSTSTPTLSTVGNSALVRERERMTLAGVFSDPFLHFVLNPQGSNPGLFSGSVALRYQFVRV